MSPDPSVLRRLAAGKRRGLYVQLTYGRPFRQLLFNNFVTGCTSLCTRYLVANALPFPEDLLYHDWWLGLLATRLGGIEVLPDRLIRYRQHSLNRIGEDKKPDVLEKVKAVREKFAGRSFTREINSMKSMRGAPFFSEEDRRVFDDRIRFFEKILGPPIRFRASSTRPTPWSMRSIMAA